MSNEKILSRVKELMDAGTTMEEALAKALDEVVKATPVARTAMTADARIAWISGIQDLQELRRAIKVAFAKKSKADKDPVKVARYNAEIKAGQEQLNTLMAEVNNAQDPMKKAQELNESKSGLVQIYLGIKESKVGDLKDYRDSKKLTNAELKALILKLDPKTPESVENELRIYGEAVLKTYNERVEHGDQRVIKLNRAIRLLETK